MPFDFMKAPETKPLTEVQRVLLRAADELERRGHCKGVLFGPRGEVCLRGAIMAALGLNSHADYWDRHMLMAPHFNAADEAVANYLKCDVVDWNNAPGRTKEEVVAALRSAAR